MYSYILYLFLILLFLLLSAFFSGIETAVFSISRFRVKSLLVEEKKGAEILEEIKKNPGKVLASILLANLLVNIGAASVATIILIQIIKFYDLNATFSFIAEFIVMTSVLLIIGEITPKTIALANAERLSLRFARIVMLIAKFFSPVAKFMQIIARGIVHCKVEPDYAAVSEKEIKVMLNEAKKLNILTEEEEKFANQILKFGKIKVCEIMTPRQKVIGVNLDASIDQVRKIISQEKHSRICVYDKQKDVVGILYAKDLFMSINNLGIKDKSSFSLKRMMREPYIVPETKYIHNLLGEFRRKGIHISVVVDEFGNFTGIVTLEDILESLYGEIVDEYDKFTDVPYRKIGIHSYIFKGDITIGELSSILGIEPFYEEGERLSAFILNYFKKLPKENEKIILKKIEMTIAEINDRSIDKVIIKKL